MSTSSHRAVNNDPWAVLIALASLIIFATITAIFVVCMLWKRYLKKRAEYEYSLQSVYGKSAALQSQEYEIQVK